jgi:hypothetical protein
VPSIPHHLNDMLYKSSVTLPLSYSLNSLLKLCEKRRMPRIKEEIDEIDKKEFSVYIFNHCQVMFFAFITYSSALIIA